MCLSLALCKVLRTVLVPRSPRGRDSLLPALQQAAAGTSRYQQAEISSVGTSRRLQATMFLTSSSAIDIFSIPAMSSECEREFSFAGDVVTSDRNQLDDKTIESLELQKSWLNKGLLD